MRRQNSLQIVITQRTMMTTTDIRIPILDSATIIHGGIHTGNGMVAIILVIGLTGGHHGYIHRLFTIPITEVIGIHIIGMDTTQLRRGILMQIVHSTLEQLDINGRAVEGDPMELSGRVSLDLQEQ